MNFVCLFGDLPMVMDDGELDFSNYDIFSGTNIGDMPGSCSLDSFFDELLKDTHACTHAHTCNPPGPDSSHTHTCYHVHTKIVNGSSDDKDPSNDTAESADKKSKKRPVGNREAVRKYREKKKARAASLEDEVVRLREINQHLVKKLHDQAALEAEVNRLKCLLVDIRGRIEGEIGAFPYQKPTKSGIYQNPGTPSFRGAYVMNPCDMQSNDQVYCLHPGTESRNEEDAVLNAQAFGVCDFENLHCSGHQSSALKVLPSCAVPVVDVSNGNKRKGRTHGERAN